MGVKRIGGPIAAVVAMAMGVAVAFGAVGDITPEDCAQDDASAELCTVTQFAIDGVSGIAITPDGGDLYTASQIDQALAKFTRDTADGSLGSDGCIDDDDTGPESCVDVADGLATAAGVAVSPDGTSVYVASAGDAAVVHFDRDPGTGALTFIGCIDDDDTGADACASSTDGLEGAQSVAVTPDGESVYVASSVDAAVVHLDRDPGTGALTATDMDCVDDADAGEAPDDCNDTEDGLDGAQSIVATNNSVYVAAFSDSAVVRLDRNTGSGVLTPQECIDDNEGAQAPDTCVNGTTDALHDVWAVALSPDGNYLYATSNQDDAITRFARAPGGALTAPACWEDNDTNNEVGCAAGPEGLNGATGLTVAPTGQSVYVVSALDNALAHFFRDIPSGALTFVSCTDDEDTGAEPSCSQNSPGLDGAFAVAVSPQSNNVYVTSQTDDSVVRFAREAEDADGDGLADFADSCPFVPGPPANNGCPVADPGPGPNPTPVQSELPPPEPNETVNLGVVEGTVRIRLPGQNDFFVMTDEIQVPIGTLIDVTQGRVRLVSASDNSGGIRVGEFYDGVFEVQQEEKRGTLTTVLDLPPKWGCGKRAIATISGKKGNGLWGSENGGGHKTNGNKGSGSTRGTIWFVGDTCNGKTIAKVTEGKVKFKDFEEKKTVILKPGDKYVAG